MTTKGKRVSAKLETRVAVVETKLSSLEQKFDSFDRKLDAMSISLARNKGFWGAITLVTGAIWTAITMFGSQITGLFTGGR